MEFSEFTFKEYQGIITGHGKDDIGEFEIVNVEEAKEGCAVLVIKTGRTTTDVAIKTSKLNKQGIWHNRERQIGRWAKVKYTKVLPTDKLFQPVCLEIYEKKEDAK